MIRKTIATLGAVALVIGALFALRLTTASASPTSTTRLGPYDVIGGAQGSPIDGTATIVLDSTAQTATITFVPGNGLSFTGGFVCVGDNNAAANTGYFTAGTGFTARVNPGTSDAKGCPPSGSAASSFVLQNFTGGGPWVIDNIPSSWFSDGMYLQIHVTVSNGDTGFPCFVAGTPFYGNCTDPGGTPVPLGTIGGIGAAVVAGGALGYVQIRRQRRNRLQATSI